MAMLAAPLEAQTAAAQPPQPPPASATQGTVRTYTLPPDKLQQAIDYARARNWLEFLLERGAEVSAQDKAGQTALHWACVGGQAEAARILIAHRAPLELKNSYGGTPLDQAAWSAAHDELGIDYLPVVEVLLAAGADVGAVAIPTGHARIDEALRRGGGTTAA